MPHRVLYNVDLPAWLYGTIKKHRQGESWQDAWVETYREIGGTSKTGGRKGCPMIAARTLYEFGRVKDGGLPFEDRAIPALWNYSRNGTYAILATKLLRIRPHLSATTLWLEIQHAVRREVGEEPARSNQGGPTLAYKLWHLGLIVDARLARKSHQLSSRGRRDSAVAGRICFAASRTERR